MHQQSLLAAIAASLATLPLAQASMYPKNSPVLQLDSRSYDRLIAQSNHTSIVEFYAPWCGHCKNLKPAYEKAAKNLEGLAKVAAIDCDADANKPFCGSMGIQGFPTLKIVRPGKKPGKPIVEDYQGGRTASAIAEAVVSKINNHVKRLADKDLDGFLAGDKPKAILFTEKGTTSGLLRSLAIDYLDVISVGQARDKETAAVAKFGITSFPTFVLIPGDGKDPITYKGELNKKDMLGFLKQVGEPNPDPAPATSKSNKKASKEETAKEEAKEAESSTTTPAAAPEPTLIEIPAITSKEKLEEQCLQSKSQTCILALNPAGVSETTKKVLASLSQIHTKYLQGKRHTFPFYSITTDIEGVSSLKEALGINHKSELIAMNARRGWWRRYDGDFAVHSVEAWIDAIRMGEGEKQKLPEGVIVEEVVETATEEAAEATPEAEPAPKVEEETEHDEL